MSKLETYGKYRPTEYDRAGAFLPDKSAWLVAPVSRTRDSAAYEQSNFETARKMLTAAGAVFGADCDDNDGHTAELHRFGHWGPGWFEIMILAPGSAAAREAERIAERLEDYPLLDEDDASAREWNEAGEFWASLTVAWRVEYCQEAGISIFAARRPELPDSDRIFERLTRA